MHSFGREVLPELTQTRVEGANYIWKGLRPGNQAHDCCKSTFCKITTDSHFCFSLSAKLKTNKEVCLNPEIKWLQQYIRNAMNK